jgi:hypothetical protein
MAMTTLLLGAVLSGVLVFLMSSILHMVVRWHANDFSKIPDEDGVMTALRPFKLAPGSYVMPRPSSMKDMGSPEFKEKYRLGPSAMLHVLPGGSGGMGKQLGLWFVYSVLIALAAGYITSRGVGPGAPFMGVVKYVGAIAFLGYAAGGWQEWIWYSRSSAVTLKSTIDGIIYGALTGLAYALLWPK